jgi:hypothetical protein
MASWLPFRFEAAEAPLSLKMRAALKPRREKPIDEHKKAYEYAYEKEPR